MRKLSKPALSWLVSCLVSSLVSLTSICGHANAASNVYRCGNVYAQVPCADGKRVDVDDSRTDAQRASAHDVALREAALAARMQRDREVDEAARSPVRKLAKAKAHTPAASSPTRAAKRLKTRYQDEDGNFVALLPAPPKVAKTK